MAMKVLGEESPIDIFVKASDILANAVEHTLGPCGSNTAVCTSSSGVYQIINDGKSIVQDITSDDPALAPAIELLKQSCYTTNRNAGDGTTSTVLMTNKLLHLTYDYMKKNQSNPVIIRQQLLDARDKILDYVDSKKIEITEDDYESVARVALGGKEYSKVISDAYKFVGKEGTVTFIREDRRDVFLDCQDGITLDKSELKIVPMKEAREFYDTPVVFLYEKVDRFSEIIDLLNHTTNYKGKKVLVFYNEMSWDASSNIYANIGSGNIDIIPIRLGSYGVNTLDVMKQLAQYAGTNLIDGLNIKLATIEDMNTVFGKFSKALISESKVVVNSENKIENNSDYSLKLQNKSCIIRVGGVNEVDREETFRRIEDAVSSLSTAIKYGITVGGGLAYLNAFESICADTSLDFLVQLGETIYKTIIYNMCGMRNIPDEYIGLFPGKDSTDDWTELNSKVYDSIAVIKEVVNNSFTLVAQMITTVKLVHEMIR